MSVRQTIQARESFNAAHIVGYLDTIDEMGAVYERYKGYKTLSADGAG